MSIEIGREKGGQSWSCLGKTLLWYVNQHLFYVFELGQITGLGFNNDHWKLQNNWLLFAENTAKQRERVFGNKRSRTPSFRKWTRENHLSIYDLEGSICGQKSIFVVVIGTKNTLGQRIEFRFFSKVGCFKDGKVFHHILPWEEFNLSSLDQSGRPSLRLERVLDNELWAKIFDSALGNQEYDKKVRRPRLPIDLVWQC